MLNLLALLLFTNQLPGTGYYDTEKEVKPQDGGNEDRNQNHFKKMVTKNLITLSLYQGALSFIALVTSLIKIIIDDPNYSQILGCSSDKVVAISMVSMMIAMVIFSIGYVLRIEWRV